MAGYDLTSQWRLDTKGPYLDGQSEKKRNMEEGINTPSIPGCLHCDKLRYDTELQDNYYDNNYSHVAYQDSRCTSRQPCRCQYVFNITYQLNQS